MSDQANLGAAKDETYMGSLPLDAAATVGDVAAAFTQYEESSASARARFPYRKDLAYGEAPVERLDFFPAGPDTPLVVFIHGGYWRRLDKADYSFVAQGLLPLGISFASINYGQTPETPLRHIIEQCRRAVSWLSAGYDRLQFDPARVSVVGHSAGGHLAAMTALKLPVHSVVSLSGVHDLIPVQQSFANEWLRLDEHQARELSPITYRPLRALPVFATAGELESNAFKGQGKALIDAWTPFGCRGEYADSPGDNHFSLCLRLRDPQDWLTQKLASLAATGSAA